MRTTNIWIVLDEETLETMKNEDGTVAKFHFKAWANKAASEKLNIWTCINVHFQHKFISHSAN